ncbi:MAG: glycoside hydrolase family 5 protein [Anaerolineae bacterium]|nr:glycoside hydrolase family 5 protein [Anaerolineae bacterium]
MRGMNMISAKTDPNSAFVTVEGRQIVGPDGRPMLLKGIGIGDWLLPEGYMWGFRRASSPRLINEVICQLIGEEQARGFWKTFYGRFFTQKDVRFLKQAGFNHVRVPFNWRLFATEDDPRRLAGIGYDCLDRTIEWCKAEGLYVVLDMHGAPGGQTGDNIDDSWGYPFLYECPQSQSLTIDLWASLAERYGNEPTVIGYDLFNEPIATHFDRELLNPKLEPLYKRIASAIRAYDPNHILFLGGAQWDTNFNVFGPPFDDKLAYTFHRYWQDVTPALIEEYIAFSERYNVPLWMGESGENTYEWIAAFRKLLEANGIGWCFWTYKRLDTDRCVVSIPKTPEWDVIVAFAEHERSTFKDVREQRPPRQVIDLALGDYLDHIQFDACRINEGYLAALGLTSSQ